MPYPLVKLSDALRCRLNDLSTPVERYQLQIANGNDLLCPQKLVRAPRVYNLIAHFDRTPTTLKVEYQNSDEVHVSDKEDRVVVCENTVALVGATKYDLAPDRKLFNNVLLRPETIIFKNCMIESEFIVKLVALTATPNVKIINIQGIDMQILDLSEILAMFPHLEELEVKDVILPRTWLTDIMDMGKNNLRRMVISCRNLLTVLDKNELLTFLKGQPENFRLNLELSPHQTQDPRQSELAYFLKDNLKNKTNELVHMSVGTNPTYDYWRLPCF